MNEERRVIYCVFFVDPEYIYSPVRSQPDGWRSVPLLPLSSRDSSILSLHSLRRRLFLIWIQDNGWCCTAATDNSTPLARRKLLQSQIFFMNTSYEDFTLQTSVSEYLCVQSVSSLYVGHRITLVTRTAGKRDRCTRVWLRGRLEHGT